MKIASEIIDLTTNIFTFNPNVIHLDTNLVSDLGFDSLAIVHLQVAIEDEFEIRFDPVNTDFITVFETVGSLSDFLSTIKSTKEIL
jgi:acyl carrier protein